MIVNYILILILLLLFVGLGTDAGMLEWRNLQLSAAARASAIGGSIGLQRYGSDTVTVTGGWAASLNGFTNGTNGVTVTFDNPPTTGPYSGNSYSVRCIITQSVPTAFMGLAGFPKVTVSAYYDQPGTAVVSLSSAFNVLAIVKDGTSISTSGGLDDNGYAYSANALDSVRTTNNLGPLLAWRGNLFSLGPLTGNNGVSQVAISLTQSKFSQLLMLAATVWNYTGSKTNTSFIVTYTDGSSATTTFALMNDWCTGTPGWSAAPGISADEVKVALESYRDYGAPGTQKPSDTCTPSVFGYTINLDNTKTVKTLALPTTATDQYARDTIVLAVDLVP